MPPWRSLIGSTASLLALIPIVQIAIWQMNHSLAAQAWGESIMCLMIAILLERLMRHPLPALNGRAICWIGQLSYSLYLWHMLGIQKDAFPHPLRLALALAAGVACHYLVERPVLKLRDRHKAPTPARIAAVA